MSRQEFNDPGKNQFMLPGADAQEIEEGDSVPEPVARKDENQGGAEEEEEGDASPADLLNQMPETQDGDETGWGLDGPKPTINTTATADAPYDDGRPLTSSSKSLNPFPKADKNQAAFGSFGAEGGETVLKPLNQPSATDDCNIVEGPSPVARNLNTHRRSTLSSGGEDDDEKNFAYQVNFSEGLGGGHGDRSSTAVNGTANGSSSIGGRKSKGSLRAALAGQSIAPEHRKDNYSAEQRAEIQRRSLNAPQINLIDDDKNGNDDDEELKQALLLSEQEAKQKAAQMHHLIDDDETDDEEEEDVTSLVQLQQQQPQKEEEIKIEDSAASSAAAKDERQAMRKENEIPSDARINFFGKFRFEPWVEAPYAGLPNSAGDNYCYLNSLVQLLWNLSGFREAVFETQSRIKVCAEQEKVEGSDQDDDNNCEGEGEAKDKKGEEKTGLRETIVLDGSDAEGDEAAPDEKKDKNPSPTAAAHPLKHNGFAVLAKIFSSYRASVSKWEKLRNSKSKASLKRLENPEVNLKKLNDSLLAKRLATQILGRPTANPHPLYPSTAPLGPNPEKVKPRVDLTPLEQHLDYLVAQQAAEDKVNTYGRGTMNDPSEALVTILGNTMVDLQDLILDEAEEKKKAAQLGLNERKQSPKVKRQKRGREDVDKQEGSGVKLEDAPNQLDSENHHDEREGNSVAELDEEKCDCLIHQRVSFIHDQRWRCSRPNCELGKLGEIQREVYSTQLISVPVYLMMEKSGELQKEAQRLQDEELNRLSRLKERQEKTVDVDDDDDGGKRNSPQKPAVELLTPSAVPPPAEFADLVASALNESGERRGCNSCNEPCPIETHIKRFPQKEMIVHLSWHVIRPSKDQIRQLITTTLQPSFSVKRLYQPGTDIIEAGDVTVDQFQSEGYRTELVAHVTSIVVFYGAHYYSFVLERLAPWSVVDQEAWEGMQREKHHQKEQKRKVNQSPNQGEGQPSSSLFLLPLQRWWLLDDIKCPTYVGETWTELCCFMVSRGCAPVVLGCQIVHDEEKEDSPCAKTRRKPSPKRKASPKRIKNEFALAELDSASAASVGNNAWYLNQTIVVGSGSSPPNSRPSEKLLLESNLLKAMTQRDRTQRLINTLAYGWRAAPQRKNSTKTIAPPVGQPTLDAWMQPQPRRELPKVAAQNNNHNTTTVSGGGGGIRTVPSGRAPQDQWPQSGKQQTTTRISNTTTTMTTTGGGHQAQEEGSFWNDAPDDSHMLERMIAYREIVDSLKQHEFLVGSSYTDLQLVYFAARIVNSDNNKNGNPDATKHLNAIVELIFEDQRTHESLLKSNWKLPWIPNHPSAATDSILHRPSTAHDPFSLRGNGGDNRSIRDNARGAMNSAALTTSGQGRVQVNGHDLGPKAQTIGPPSSTNNPIVRHDVAQPTVGAYGLVGPRTKNHAAVLASRQEGGTHNNMTTSQAHPHVAQNFRPHGGGRNFNNSSSMRYGGQGSARPPPTSTTTNHFGILEESQNSRPVETFLDRVNVPRWDPWKPSDVKRAFPNTHYYLVTSWEFLEKCCVAMQEEVKYYQQLQKGGGAKKKGPPSNNRKFILSFEMAEYLTRCSRGILSVSAIDTALTTIPTDIAKDSNLLVQNGASQENLLYDIHDCARTMQQLKPKDEDYSEGKTGGGKRKQHKQQQQQQQSSQEGRVSASGLAGGLGFVRNTMNKLSGSIMKNTQAAVDGDGGDVEEDS